jgi:hypothetical protein
MKNKERIARIAATASIIGLSAFSAAGCSKEAKTNETVVIPAHTETVILVPTTVTRTVTGTQISTTETPTKISEIPYTYKHINPGESAFVGNNDFIMGDVTLLTNQGEIDLFDNRPETDLIVDVQIPALVKFKYGGDIVTVINSADKLKQIENAKKEKLEADRSRGVNEVDVIRINNDWQRIQGR